MESQFLKCIFLSLLILHLQYKSVFCEVVPKVDLQISYQIPDNASKPMNLELTCNVDDQDGSDLFMLSDISISKRMGRTKRPEMLGRISTTTIKPVSFCEGHKVVSTGHINQTSGSLKIDLTTGQDDHQIYDYVCSVQYVSTERRVKVIQFHSSNPFVKLYNYLLAKHDSNIPDWAEQKEIENKRLLTTISADLKQKFEDTHKMIQNLQDKVDSSKLQLMEYVDEKTKATEKKLSTYVNLISGVTSCTKLQKTNPIRSQRQVAVYPDGTRVLCDTQTDGGGWAIFQRRVDGSTSFYRGWDDYVNGFGDLNRNFWLGLKHIRDILKQGGPYELRVDLDYKGKGYYARYSTFDILDAATHYQLKVGGYSGTAGDSLAGHNGMAFSTFDADHDPDRRNCAVDYTGAWWYRHCHYSNLNGKWGEGSWKGPIWAHTTERNPATYTEMKFRPKSHSG